MLGAQGVGEGATGSKCGECECCSAVPVLFCSAGACAQMVTHETTHERFKYFGKMSVVYNKRFKI